ncbi:NUDIX domain-containing protein [Flavobacteriaceae bacterium S356]|uniref:NUDIX domain-containing protein n=1 Tax=Asprobacillus argus TaxID=3076534 RepID=A0ABU3LKC3_9FLAO|nr:NUDIX domain-containing protein [Flavobacteriaceae bacterium S356]
MDEFIDILTTDGTPTGNSCLKSIAHQKGYYHATVHVWFYTSNKQLLLQKRGAQKKTYPNRWDVSVAGHVHAGESIENAAVREILEEIGLDVTKNQLRKIAVRKGERSHPNGIQDNEFYHVFLCELTKSVEELSMQEEEVDDLKLFEFNVLKSTNKKISLVPDTSEYYQFIISTIEAILG